MTGVHFYVLFMKGWCVCNSLSVKQCLRLVNHYQFPCKWHRIGSTTSGWKSSPRKIFHQNSSGERWLKFIGKRIEEDNHQNRTVKATSSTQQPAHTCTEAVTTHYIHCKQNWWREGTPTADASKSDEKIGQWLKFTFKIIFFNAVAASQLHDLYNAHQEYLSIRLWTPISLYTPWATMGFAVSFILQWTV